MNNSDWKSFQRKRQVLLEELYSVSRPGSLDYEGFTKGRYTQELERIVSITLAINTLEQEFEYSAWECRDNRDDD
jgi:hypothetical protein